MDEFVKKLIERLEEHIFCAELHDYGWEGQTVHSLLLLGDVKDIADELAEEYNKKQEHEVWLNGCDDDTIFTMEMTNSGYEFLKRVSELANETSTYYCMPRLYLDESVGYTPSYTEGESR